MRADSPNVIPLTVLAQAGLAVSLALLGWVWQGPTVALSALAGGMAAVIPNAFLGARLIGSGERTSGRSLLRAAWFGVIGKLLLTIVLFGAIFALLKPVSAPAVFGAFIATQLVIFGALLLDGMSGRT